MRLLTFSEPDALRDHLDALNDAGLPNEIAGTDANGHAFLAGLSGPYADGTFVLYISPWDSDASLYGSERCDECGAERADRNIEALRYPVMVVATDVEEVTR